MPEPAHVVIAEEEPMIARILEHKLRREGHRVQCVRDVSALEDALAEGSVDVLLYDVRIHADELPRARAGWLAIIDGRDDAAAHAAMARGAAGLVRMPFKPTDVAAQVTTLLQIGAAR